MAYTFRTMIYIVALMTITTAQADQLELEPFSAVYSARYSGISLEATRALAHSDGNQWTMTTEARNFMGQISETSRFHLEDGTIRSDYYRYQRRLLGASKREEQLFDWVNKVSGYYVDRGPNSEPRREIALDQPLYDRSNYQLRLAQDLRDDKPELSYQIADRGRQREYRFERMGEEVLDTAHGRIDTIKVMRLRDDDDRETILWFAPALNYLLIQLEHTEEGKGSHTMKLVRINHIGSDGEDGEVYDNANFDHTGRESLVSGAFHGK